MSASVRRLETFAGSASEQDPEFVSVQARVYARDPDRYRLVEQVALRIALDNGPVVRHDDVRVLKNGKVENVTTWTGGVTANDIQDVIDPHGKNYPDWFWGLADGTLSRSRFLRVGDEGRARPKSRRPGSKGRRINQWELAPGAIRDAPVPVLPPTEVPS
ncbi:MAG: hypothetical protein WAN74_00645 [Thermoplasmata archaeon]